MQAFKADIIVANKKGRVIFYAIVGIVFLCVAVLLALQIIPVALQVFTIAFWLAAVFKYFLQSKKQIIKKTVGVLLINENGISIHNDDYSYAQIKSIELLISGWKSHQRSFDRGQPIQQLNNGDKNFLTLYTSTGKIGIEFLLTTQEHWCQLREYVVQWHRDGINLKEANAAGKTYGLQTLNYKEIQKYKQQVQNAKTVEI